MSCSSPKEGLGRALCIAVTLMLDRQMLAHSVRLSGNGAVASELLTRGVWE